MALEKIPSRSVSEGIQCELGCESLRNCQPHVKKEFIPSPDDLSNVEASHISACLISPHENGELINTSEIIDSQNQMRISHTQYVCGFCGETFLVLEDLESHGYSYHLGDMPFKCHYCGRLFKAWLGPNGFRAHLKSSCALASGNSFPCRSTSGDCTENISSPSQHHLIDFCELVCGDCGLQFSESHLYEKHCRSHNGDQPFKCIECDMRCRKRQQLEEHKASHLLVNPYHCSECGKEFSFKWAFLVHAKEHGNENYVMCCVCGALFLNQDYMASHKLLEHNDFPENDLVSFEIIQKGCEVHSGQLIPCSMCQEKKDDRYDRNFSSLTLVCEECGVQFICEEDLQGHMQCHETNQPFKCEECNKSYGSYLGLREHVNSNHSDIEVTWCEGCSGTGYIHVSMKNECEGSDEELHNIEVIQEMVEIEEGDNIPCLFNPLPLKNNKHCTSEEFLKSSKRKFLKDSEKAKQTSKSTTKPAKSRNSEKDKQLKKSVCRARIEIRTEKVPKGRKDSKTSRQGKNKRKDS